MIDTTYVLPISCISLCGRLFQLTDIRGELSLVSVCSTLPFADDALNSFGMVTLQNPFLMTSLSCGTISPVFLAQILLRCKARELQFLNNPDMEDMLIHDLISSLSILYLSPPAAHFGADPRS